MKCKSLVSVEGGEWDCTDIFECTFEHEDCPLYDRAINANLELVDDRIVAAMHNDEWTDEEIIEADRNDTIPDWIYDEIDDLEED